MRGRVVLTVGKVGPGNAGYYESAVVAGGGLHGTVMRRGVGLVVRIWWVLSPAVWRLPLTPSCCWKRSAHLTDLALGKTTVTERSVTAFDLTFSAPKSASVLYALGDPAVSAAVEAAFTAAVEQAIASLSPRIAYTRTGHAGAAVVDAEGVFGVSYRHRTSRALDPQLHDHVLISNAVRADRQRISERPHPIERAVPEWLLGSVLKSLLIGCIERVVDGVSCPLSLSPSRRLWSDVMMAVMTQRPAGTWPCPVNTACGTGPDPRR